MGSPQIRTMCVLITRILSRLPSGLKQRRSNDEIVAKESLFPLTIVHPNLLEDKVRNKDKGVDGIGDAPKITTKANEASPTTSSLPALNFP